MNKKKTIKLIGNIITSIVIFFIAKRLLSYDIDWKMLFRPDNFFILFLLIIGYSLNVVLICIPWKVILEIITSVKIKFKEIVLISCRSNALKYIPGNVFQYVGRNQIAFKLDFNHLDVGISTIIDVFINILSIFLTSLILYFPGIKIWIDKFGLLNLKVVIMFLILFVLIVAIASTLLREKIIYYIKRYRVLFTKESLKKIFLCMLYYSMQGIFTAIIYIIVVKYIVGVQLPNNKLNIIVGAFLLSWILGFIMIGAPAGIGIREGSMALLIKDIIPTEEVLLSMLIYRIITTFGDAVALFFAKVISLKYSRRVDK